MLVIGRALPAALRTIVLTVGLVVTGLMVTTSSAGAAPTARAATAATSLSSETYEQRVQAVINRVRSAHGLRALSLHACTDGTAEHWALRLALSGRLVHQDPGDIVSTCRASYASETLGMGTFSPAGLVRAWMSSPVHRPLLLNRNARHIGVGTYLRDGQWVTAANFTRL